MATLFKLCVIFSIIVIVCSRNSQDLEAKKKNVRKIMNFYNSKVDTPTRKINKRHARRNPSQTHSLELDRLITQLKYHYNNEVYDPKSPISKLVRNLIKEIKRHEHEKMVMDKKKKKEMKKNKERVERERKERQKKRKGMKKGKTKV